MKVALIAPPAWANWAPHPALLRLGAELHANNIEVELYDLNVDCFNVVNDEFRTWWDDENSYKWESPEYFNEFWEANENFFIEYSNMVVASQPDMVGFCINSGARNAGPNFARIIRKALPKVPIVFGGPDCFRSELFTGHMIPGVVDALCPGEGDFAIIDIANAIAKEGSVPVDIPGFVTWENGQIRDNGDPRRPSTLDVLNPISLEGVSLVEYQLNNRVTISISRGCVKRCAFCSEGPNFFKFRTHSANWMFNQLKTLVPQIASNTKEIPHINFNDSLINGNMEVLGELCDLIIKNGLKFSWGGMAIVRPEMTVEFVSKMQKAGCIEICWGIESGSTRVLNLMRKNLAVSLVDEVMRNASEAGVAQYGNIIVGFPGEGPFEFAESLFFAAKNISYLSSLGLPIFMPRKNSTVYKAPHKFGMASLDTINWHTDDNDNTPEIRIFRRKLISYVISERFFDQGKLNKLKDSFQETFSSERVISEFVNIANDFYQMLSEYRDLMENLSFNIPNKLELNALRDSETLNFSYNTFLSCLDNFKQFCETNLDKLPIIPDRVEEGEIRKTVSRGKLKIVDSQNSCSPVKTHSSWVTVGNHQPEEEIKFKYSKEKTETINSFIGFLEGKNIPNAPLELFLEVSNVCNLKCAMCPTFSGLNKYRFNILKERQRGFFDIKENKVALEEVLKRTLNVHCFGYGEPTIHPDFKEFLKFLGKYEVMLDFFTNGMGFTSELCQLLVKEHVAKVTISFSGVTKTEYENVYIGGVFEEVLGGMKRLADTKKAYNSLYPKIEINSLSFEHHVAKLPKFVELMSEHGANIIHLKSLQQHESIAELSGHKAVYRQWVEGLLVEEARQIAAKKGIIFSATQFENLKVDTDEEWKKEKYRTCTDTNQSVNDFFPLSSLKAKARETKPYRDVLNKEEEKLVNVMQIPSKQIDEVLQMKDFKTQSGDSFYCMEPFKTMYVNRDGTVKTCCFSNHNAPNLGALKTNDLSEIWQGKGYSTFREGALESKYAMDNCNFCLKNGIGPKEHFTHGIIGEYVEWYKNSYDKTLVDSPAEVILALGNNRDIALRYRNGHKSTESVNKSNENLLQDLGQFNGSDNLEYRLDKKQPEGHLDRVENGIVYGWVWNPKEPESRQYVTIYVNQKEVARVEARDYRADLKEAGKGDGYYSFRYHLPKAFLTGVEVKINAKVDNLDFSLRGEDIIYS